MLNDLRGDPRIRDHFQFWFFAYETGNPVVYSAMLLRDALQAEATLSDLLHGCQAPRGTTAPHAAYGHAISALHHVRMCIAVLCDQYVEFALKPEPAEVQVDGGC